MHSSADTEQKLRDLLDRVPLVLKADQQRPISADLFGEIKEIIGSKRPVNLTVEQLIALGNVYFMDDDPVDALDCYWTAMARADNEMRLIATNNLGVCYFGFCPGFISKEIFKGVVKTA